MSAHVIPSTVLVEHDAADEVSAVDPAPVAQPITLDRLVESDLLVEDVSIDGMCGVY